MAHLLHGSGVVPYTGTFGGWPACHMAPYLPMSSFLLVVMVVIQVKQIPEGLVSIHGAVGGQGWGKQLKVSTVLLMLLSVCFILYWVYGDNGSLHPLHCPKD